MVAVLAGCAADGPIDRKLTGQAGLLVELAPDLDNTEPADAAFRWQVIAAPEASHATADSTLTKMSFRPDLRGTYVVARWMRYGVSEDLTYRFFVEAAGTRPVPAIAGPGGVAVGAQVVLDASGSSSVEGRPLSFVWRLTTRPRDSAAMLTDLQATATSFTADAGGTYEVELAAFDGELWSEPHATLAISAQ